jgi:hypothetical protein
VTVVDTTPPELTLPAPVTVRAPATTGAAVTFTASSADAIAVALTPSCSPPSDSVFPVGTTTVSCTADDGHGNVRTGTFTVTVLPPPRPDLVLASATGTSFTIANRGDAPAGVFTVTVQGVGAFTFAGLPAGASATRTVTCASVRRAVAVDPENRVLESDEGNNTGRVPAWP